MLLQLHFFWFVTRWYLKLGFVLNSFWTIFSKAAIVQLKGALERGSAVWEKASKGGRDGTFPRDPTVSTKLWARENYSQLLRNCAFTNWNVCHYIKFQSQDRISSKMFYTQNIFLHVSISQSFFPIWSLLVLIYYIWETSRTKLKKHSVSKILQILGLQPQISKHFLNQ